MNVKCPNCRYKFDVNPTDVNENNEVSCSCPRCGKSFATEVKGESVSMPQAEVPKADSPTSEERVPQQSQSSQVEGTEIEIYYTAMKCMESGRAEDARPYVTRLLQLNPNEPLYIKFKEQLDQADEAKRREEERIKQLYFSAMKCIDNGQFDHAETHIKSLLETNPDEPMYLNLRDKLAEAKRIEAEHQKHLREQEEARKLEEERREAQELYEKERKAFDAMFSRAELDTELMKKYNLSEAQVNEAIDIITSLPQEVKEHLAKWPLDQLADWSRMPTNEKQQWAANAKEHLLTPEQKRQREEEQLYEKAKDYINQGLLNTAQDYVDKLLEKNPNDKRFLALHQKLNNRGNDASNSSGSGCMVVILAIIISLASIFAF